MLEKIKILHNLHEKLKEKIFTAWSNIYIEPSLISIKDAVAKKNQTAVITAARMLTINRNNCHEVNKVAFIKVDN